MFANILGGIGGLVKGVGALGGGIVQGIGTLAGGLAQGVGTLAGGLGQWTEAAIGAAPEIISAVKPGVDLVSQWQRQRAEEKIYREAAQLQRERLDAEKQIALQKILLSSRIGSQTPVYQIQPKESTATPIVQLIPSAPRATALPKQDNMILVLIFAVIGFLLLTKK